MMDEMKERDGTFMGGHVQIHSRVRVTYTGEEVMNRGVVQR